MATTRSPLSSQLRRRTNHYHVGFNGGSQFTHNEAFSFQIATDTQEETDRYWNAIVSNGGEESACGWCKDRWGISWQITPRVLIDAVTSGGAEARRAFAAMIEMGKIDINRGRTPWLMRGRWGLINCRHPIGRI